MDKLRYVLQNLDNEDRAEFLVEFDRFIAGWMATAEIDADPEFKKEILRRADIVMGNSFADAELNSHRLEMGGKQ